MLRKFFLFCSGVNTDVLERCPTETSKYLGIGGTVVTTAIFAALSGGYAMDAAFSNAAVAIPFGLLWGASIGNLDRLIISSMRRQKQFRHEVLVAAPRLMLAAGIALVIAKPLELRIFASEINLKMETTRQAELSKHQEWLEHAPAYDQSHQSLQEDIRENKATLTRVKAERDARYQDMIREAEGTAGSLQKGKGPLYYEKLTEFQKAEQQLHSAQSEATKHIQQDEHNLALLEKDQKRQQDAFSSRQAQAVTLLAQLEALSTLSEERGTVHLTSLGITLLFLMLELSPVLAKLMLALSSQRPYDDMLEAIEKENQAVEKHQHASNKAVRDKDLQITVDKSEAERMVIRQITTEAATAMAILCKAQIDFWREEELEHIPARMAAWFKQNQPQPSYPTQPTPQTQATAPATPQAAYSSPLPVNQYVTPPQPGQPVMNGRHGSP